MSVVTALSLVLVVGFLATGLVGFLGWRQRMREGAGFSASSSDALKINSLTRWRKTDQDDLEGARL